MKFFPKEFIELKNAKIVIEIASSIFSIQLLEVIYKYVNVYVVTEIIKKNLMKA